MTTRRLVILGSTGSIGTQALEVIAHINTLAHSEDLSRRSPISFEVVGLAAGKNSTLLAEQARRFGVKNVALADGERGGLGAGDLPSGCRVLRGASSAEELVRSVDCDMVLAAMVGVAGLPATLAAVECGRSIALANKETLVAAGEIVSDMVSDRGVDDKCNLLPVDSEHAALFQVLRPVTEPPLEGDWDMHERVRRMILTASGGPFRGWTIDQLERATPEQALKHPTWNMGAKVTVDSATLMNKALELIEARWLFGGLFGPPAENFDAVIHPQSIVHAIVEYHDGSCVAQLNSPDMRTPIQAALTYRGHMHEHLRQHGLANRLDWTQARSLTFEPIDPSIIPVVRLARDVISRRGTSGAILNAANEAAVEAFLAGRTGFRGITRHVEAALADLPVREVRTLADVLAADAEAREFVRARIERGVR